MKQLLFILIVCFSLSGFARYRPIDIVKEIENAFFVGEVIFLGYDTVLINKYSYTYQPIKMDSVISESVVDSNEMKRKVYNLSQVRFQNLDDNKTISAGISTRHSWAYYVPRPEPLVFKYASQGFWPLIGDTCILVLDSNYKVSLLALLKDEEYIFWDPIINSSRLSVFAFDPPFRKYKNYTIPKKDNSSRSVAERYERKYGCISHCIIRKEDFWEDIMKELRK